MAKVKSRNDRAAWTYVEGEWREGSPKVLSPGMQAVWQSSVVFDGARAINGHLPDLDRHCARVNVSARALGMAPTHSAEEIEKLSREGVALFPDDAELYISPMYYAEDGFIVPDPESTKFVLGIYDAPLPEPKGFKAGLSSFRRPARDQAPK